MTALYCRLSKDDRNSSESMSIQSQKGMLKRFAEENGLLNTKFYVDDGYSGANFQRPAFQEMLSEIKAGLVSCVVTKDLSRLGRNYLESGTYIEMVFPKYKVRYIAINDGVDSANGSDQMDITPFKNIINEFYVRDTSKKIKSALRSRVKEGKYVFNAPPFGYMKDRDDHNLLVPNPKTAPIVQQIYQYTLAGMGVAAICKKFKQDMVPRPSAFRNDNIFARMNEENADDIYKWSKFIVDKILRNPIYKGCLVLSQRPVINCKTKERGYIPLTEAEIVEHTHEAIIEEDMWNLVQELMDSRRTSNAPTPTGYDNIFKGMLQCADCGKTLQARVVKKRVKAQDMIDKAYYVCSSKRKYGECSNHHIEARDLYDTVLKDIRKHAAYAAKNSDQMVEELAHEMMDDLRGDFAERKEQLEQLRQESEAIDQQYIALYTDKSRGVIPEQRFFKISSHLEDEQEKINQQIRELETGVESFTASEREIKEFVKQVGKYASIQKLDRTVLNLLIDKIIIYEKEEINGKFVQKIHICYKFAGNVEMCVENRKVRKAV